MAPCLVDHEAGDALKLLRIIQSMAFNFQDKRFPLASIHQATRRFFLLNQDKQSTPQPQYYESFKNNTEVLFAQGGALGEDEGIKKVVAQRM